MSNLGIILVSHGEFAKAALGSAEMIVGPQEDVIALALTVDKSLDAFEEEIAQAHDKLTETCNEIIVLCDIYGGTPFNAVSRCILKGKKVIGYTGLSLPVLIDLLLCRDLSGDEAKKRIEETHAIALTPINVSLSNDEESDLDDL